MIEATNPCGEQPLLPNEACNLGSINVATFVRRQADGVGRRLDGARARGPRCRSRFLDDVIEVNPYPLPEIDATVKANRRIGLGVMGWADLLFRMGIPYDSQPALDLGDRLMAFINEKATTSRRSSPRARAVPELAASRSTSTAARFRNSTVTTIAPTGNDLDDRRVFVGRRSRPSRWRSPTRWATASCPSRTRSSPRWRRERGFYSDAPMEEVAKRGVVHGLPGVPEEVQRVFVTAHEVAFEWHVRHQGAFQKSTDNGVSKTINLPNSATVDDVSRAYLLGLGAGMSGHHGLPGRLQGGCSRASAPRRARLTSAARPRHRRRQSSSRGRAASPGGRTESRLRSARPTSSSTSTATASPSRCSSRWARPVPTPWRGGGHGALDLARPPDAVPLSTKRRLEGIVAQLAGIGGGRPLGFGPQRVLSLPDGIAQVPKRLLGQTVGDTVTFPQ